jgi:hypothetical protein
LVSTGTPSLLFRIVLSNYPCRKSGNYGVSGDAPHHHGIDRDNTITAYCQLASWANDGCAMADPRSLADTDSAAFCKALIDNWHCDIFVRVIMVNNKDRLADDYIAFQVDSVLGGYNTAETYVAIVIKHNRGLTRGVVGGGVEPRVLSQAYRITKADPGRPWPRHLTGEMKRHITSY